MTVGYGLAGDLRCLGGVRIDALRCEAKRRWAALNTGTGARFLSGPGLS